MNNLWFISKLQRVFQHFKGMLKAFISILRAYFRRIFVKTYKYINTLAND